MIFCGLAIGRVIAPIGQRAELERYTLLFLLPNREIWQN